MRLRVDLRHGYASFSQEDEARAWELYEAEGLRIRFCKDLMDDVGVVLAGVPLTVDVSPRKWAEKEVA